MNQVAKTVEEAKAISPGDLALHLQTMMATPGWAILMQYFYDEEQKIIETGIAGRREEKTIKQWSVLAGFRKAVGMAPKLVKWGRDNSAVETPEIED